MMTQSISMQDVSEVVADHFGVSLEVLIGRCRDWEICAVRHIAFGLARELTGQSLPQIGRYFGRDHTTVLSGLRRYEVVLAVEHDCLIDEIRQRIIARSRAVFVRNERRAVFRSVRRVA